MLQSTDGSLREALAEFPDKIRTDHAQPETLRTQKVSYGLDLACVVSESAHYLRCGNVWREARLSKTFRLQRIPSSRVLITA